jgi:hypothetical protein
MVLTFSKVTKISFAKEDLEENATLAVKKCSSITYATLPVTSNSVFTPYDPDHP